MTVCIAAICNHGQSIFGACDRMMTSGDIEFEPNAEEVGIRGAVSNPKIFRPTSSIVVMTAGDSGLQSEIMADVLAVINGRIQTEPEKWLAIKDAVDCYVTAYNSAKTTRVTNDVLVPFNLNEISFLDRQGELNPDFILDINRRLLKSDLEFREFHSVEAIITGVDLTGCHIYTVVGDSMTCHDSIGFAAIGIGARHAESQFMLNGHGPYSNREETLLLTYLAKKRSEVAPGVGQETDMFVADGLGNITMLHHIPDFDMKEIDAIYQKMNKAQSKSFDAAREKTKTYIAAMFAAREKNAMSAKADKQSPPKAPAIPGIEDATENPPEP